MNWPSAMRWALAGLATMIVMTGAVIAKPSNVPIKVECTVPSDVKTGDVVTTTIRFRALDDLEQLEVSVAPFKGLELLSEPREAVFRNVAKGTAPELEVRIRLTAPKWGSLGVVFKTRSATGVASGAVTVDYGDFK